MSTPARNEYLILVVDDFLDSMELMDHVLLHHGYQVVTATSKQHALRVCRSLEQVPHAIVTDYFLGDGTGAELVNELGDKAPDVRILVSGSTELSTNRSFDFFLVKPIIPGNLSTLLDTFLLEQRRAAS